MDSIEVGMPAQFEDNERNRATWSLVNAQSRSGVPGGVSFPGDIWTAYEMALAMVQRYRRALLGSMRAPKTPPSFVYKRKRAKKVGDTSKGEGHQW